METLIGIQELIKDDFGIDVKIPDQYPHYKILSYAEVVRIIKTSGQPGTHDLDYNKVYHSFVEKIIPKLSEEHIFTHVSRAVRNNRVISVDTTGSPNTLLGERFLATKHLQKFNPNGNFTNSRIPLIYMNSLDVVRSDEVRVAASDLVSKYFGPNELIELGKPTKDVLRRSY